MTRVVIVADSGSTSRTITSAVLGLRGAHIVGYGNSRTRLDRTLRRACPELVVIGDLRTVDGALARLMEVERATPHAKVVVISARNDARWLTQALRARAAAVLPGSPEPHTLGVVLREVVEEPERAVGSARSVSVAPEQFRVEPNDRQERRKRIEQGGLVSSTIRPTREWGVA